MTASRVLAGRIREASTAGSPAEAAAEVRTIRSLAAGCLRGTAPVLASLAKANAPVAAAAVTAVPRPLKPGPGGRGGAAGAAVMGAWAARAAPTMAVKTTKGECGAEEGRGLRLLLSPCCAPWPTPSTSASAVGGNGTNHTLQPQAQPLLLPVLVPLPSLQSSGDDDAAAAGGAGGAGAAAIESGTAGANSASSGCWRRLACRLTAVRRSAGRQRFLPQRWQTLWRRENRRRRGVERLPHCGGASGVMEAAVKRALPGCRCLRR